MSWSVYSIGKKENVKPVIEAQSSLPQGLKDEIIKMIDSFEGYDGVIVETNGHHGGGIFKLEVIPKSFEHDPIRALYNPNPTP